MDLKTGEAFVEGSGDPAVRVIEIKKSVFADNDIDADNLRSELKEKGVFLLNLMSAPGSGKTTTLIRTIDILRQKIGVGLQGSILCGWFKGRWKAYLSGYLSVFY